MPRLTTLALCLATPALAAQAEPERTTEWLRDLGVATAAAAESGRPILAVFR